MSKSPAFQFYPDDFVGGKVGMMTPEEVGVYVLLLCLEWNQGGFTYDVDRLARWCRTTPKRFAAVWPVVGENFTDRDGRLYNNRLEEEREKQRIWREKSSAGGKKGADKRWHPDNGSDGGGHRGGHRLPITVDTPPSIPNDDIPFPSPSPKQQKTSRAQKRTTPKHPHFSESDCSRLYTAWGKLGRPSYPVFRNAFARLFPENPPFTVQQVERAIGACIEEAASTGRGEFVNPSGFVDRVQYWIDKSTPIVERDPARAYAMGIVA